MSTLATALQPAVPAGWLRNQRFDMIFIVALPAFALLVGATATAVPELTMPIIFVNIWVFGYHHVIATYSRLCCDRASFREHVGLLTWLPPVVLLATIALAFVGGFAAIASVYLYWQWWHYSRQSWGMAQIYRRAAGDLPTGGENFNRLIIYAMPVWGILYRSSQAPEAFLGQPVWVFPVAEPVVAAVGAASVGIFGAWIISRAVAWVEGELPLAHTLYVASHVAMFCVGYLWIEDITTGWLVVNIWHNAQYLAFVWLYNNKRFREGVSSKAWLLSTLSQSENKALYFLFFFSISTIAYGAIYSLADPIGATLVFTMAINFHHYIVDAKIWKARKPAFRRTMGLAA
jgi:hypothetical protein